MRKFFELTAALLGVTAVLMAQNYTIKTFAGVVPQTTNLSATSVILFGTYGAVVGPDGSLYASDTQNHKVWKIGTDNSVSVVIGTNNSGSPSDGKAANTQSVSNPTGLVFDSSGNLYIADSGNNAIYKVDTNGVVTKFAGGNGGRYGGDGRVATSGILNGPNQIIWYKGALYVADTSNNRIRKIAQQTVGGKPTWIITTVAGSSSSGSCNSLTAADPHISCTGDGGPAVLAGLNKPEGVAFDSSGNMFISEAGYVCAGASGSTAPLCGRVREVSASDKTIKTIAGRDLTNVERGLDSKGNSINLAVNNNGSGKALTTAGSGPSAFSGSCKLVGGVPVNDNKKPTAACALVGDGGDPIQALLAQPSSLAVDSNGNLLIADKVNNRIRSISSNGVISTVVGTGSTCNGGNCGDSGPATNASLNAAAGLSIDSAGRLIIADTGSNRVRVVDSTGVILSLTGFNLFNGDQTALTTKFFNPMGVTADSAGNVFVSDTRNNRIRKIDTQGNVTTIAGTGSNSTDDGISALSAKLSAPTGIVVDAAGTTLYFTDSGSGRIRKIVPPTGGNITTVVSGNFGTGSDNNNLKIGALALDANGNLYFTEPGANGVAAVDSSGTLLWISGYNGGGAAGDGTPAVCFSNASGPCTEAVKYNAPSGIAVRGNYGDASQQIFVADTQNHAIRVIMQDPGGSGQMVVLPFAGEEGSQNNDGNSSTIAYNRRLRKPAGLALNAAGDTLFAAISSNATIRSFNIATDVGTIIANSSQNNDNGGFGPVFAGDNVSANDSSVALSYPEAVTVDANGNVFFADSANNIIRELVPSK